MGKKRILPQMFDVFPVDKTGSLDWQKIESIGAVNKIQEEKESESLYFEQTEDLSQLRDDDFENKIAYHQQQAEIIKRKYFVKHNFNIMRGMPIAMIIKTSRLFQKTFI